MLRESTTSRSWQSFGLASTLCRTMRYIVRAWSRSFAARKQSWAGAWQVIRYWASCDIRLDFRFFFGTKIPARRNRSRPSGLRQPNSGRSTCSFCHSISEIRDGGPPRSSGCRQRVSMNRIGASAAAASQWYPGTYSGRLRRSGAADLERAEDVFLFVDLGFCFATGCLVRDAGRGGRGHAELLRQCDEVAA